MVRLGRGYPVHRIFKPPAGIVPVAYDATGAGSTGTASSGTWSHTATAGAYVLVFVTTTTSVTVSSVTYGASAMSVLGSVNLNNVLSNGVLTLLGLASAPSGAQTVTVNMSAAHSYSANSVSYLNVGSVGAAATAFGSGGTASMTVSDSSGQMIVCGLGDHAFTSVAGGTQRYLTGGGVVGTTLILDSVSSSTLSAAASGVWAGIAVVLNHP